MSLLSAEDTPQNRQQSNFWRGQIATYQAALAEGMPYLPDPAKPVHTLVVQSTDSTPPWEQPERQVVNTAKTLAANVERFIAQKRAEVERKQLSHGRSATRCGCRWRA